MRKKLFTFLLTLAASIGPLFASTKIDDLYYNLDATNKTAKVTYQLQYNKYNYSGLTTINIPSTVIYNDEEYSVTSIGYQAFDGCRSLTSVTIPNSVTSIGDQAFEDCRGLTSVMIGNSVTSIGDRAFYNCSSLTSVTIPNSVTSIGDVAFAHCTGLTSVTIPNSVTSIGTEAFDNVPNIMYSGSATGSPWGARNINGYIDGYLVYRDYTKTTLLVCSTTAQGEIIIPNSVTSIGYKAFYNCYSLTSVTIPNSVTNIGGHAFYKVPNIVYNGTATGSPWGARSINGYVDGYLVYSDNTKTTLLACSAAVQGEIIIPNSVTNIGADAFLNCSSLTSVTIPNSVTSIGVATFYYCTGLTSVTISNSVTNIGADAFLNCSSLTSVTIPNSVTSIGGRAFGDCSSLTSVYISDIASWCSISFGNIDANPLYYANNLYLNGTLVTDLIIPNAVTRIRDYAFIGCSSLTSVSIPNSVTSIGINAFGDCSNLTGVYITDLTKWCAISFDENSPNPLYYAHNLYLNGTLVTDLIIPNTVTRIRDYAFEGCTGLTSVTIPNSVTSIGIQAFYKCSNLTSVTIPNSVITIGSYAFYNCSSLKSVYPLSITPPTIESSTFKNINSDARIYLTFGTGQLGTYAIAEYWKELNLYPFMTQNQYVGATSYKISFDIEDITLQSCGISGSEQQQGNVLEYIGLEPNSEYKDVPVVLTANTGETETVNVSFSTTALELTTKPSKPVSATTAILLAETNMSDAEVSCGFEWKRNDAPADMEGNKVYCPVASGQMAGRLKGLKDDVYYKYRAFYQSAAGNMFYGDWQYIFTGDVAVEFDPILYTYGATVVRQNEATISGYALAGSEDFTEQGFEYWAESRVEGQRGNVQGTKVTLRSVPAALNEHFFVQVSGIALRATLTNLDAGTVYKYRVYGKVGDQYYYGSEQAFTTTGTYTPPTYTITFVNWDGSELQSSQVTEDDMPEYTGETPERPADEQYTYTFIGWSPVLAAATADATYTATYEANSREGVNNIYLDSQVQKLFRDGQIFIIRGDKTYTLQGQEVK